MSYKLRRGDTFTYSNGFSVGIITGFIATLVFILFFGIYAGNIAPNFFDNLIGSWGERAGLGVLLFTVAIGGFPLLLY